MKSLRVPFSVTGGRIVSTTDTEQITHQKIVNVLMTSKQERVMLPTYGAGLHALVFEAIETMLEMDWKLDTKQEIHANVTGVSVEDIQVKQVDESTADVTVYYRTPLSDVQSLRFKVVTPRQLTEDSPL